MPRAKPCGGALSERAISWLDLPVPPALVDAEVFGARVHFSEACAEVRLDRRVAVLVTRSRFDHFLVQKAEEAGARTVWAEVKAVDARPGEVRLTTSVGDFSAACAILAEGAQQRLSRAVRPPDAPGARGFCIQADAPVPPGDPYAHLRGVVDLHFGLVGRGYGWVFHHGSYYSVGVGGMCDRLSDPLGMLRRFVADRQIDLCGVRPRGHYVPCGGTRRTLVADRLLLAGDAGGWVDPFQGEGLAYALRSGQLAADAALDAAARGDLSRQALEPYEAACRRDFGRDLEAALRLARIAWRWPLLFIRALAAEEEVLARYLRVETGEVSYRDFLWWILRQAPRLWVDRRTQSRVAGQA